MFRIVHLIPSTIRRRKKALKELRRLVNERNYWRNRTKELRRWRKK